MQSTIQDKDTATLPDYHETHIHKSTKLIAELSQCTFRVCCTANNRLKYSSTKLFVSSTSLSNVQANFHFGKYTYHQLHNVANLNQVQKL